MSARKVKLEMTANEALAAFSALTEELERQRVHATRSHQQIAAIRRVRDRIYGI